ncbi:FHA domain-containing protein [Leisingera aquaemixtae]|uniref:FHA domain-containing protein n=1 Tax=Leisingera aquaemixtae TaxID=1396826 RepID=UPI0021A32032|nr:FHA domain-containing protein [Leisingera aquaemixtae]
MKFIKDIIGEKRERVRLDGAAAPAAEPVQPPAEDTGSRAPFSLGSSFRLDPEPGPPPASPDTAAALTEAFRDAPDAPAADLDGEPDDDFAGLSGPEPEEDAIAAFFAREQTRTAAPDRPDTAAFFAAPEHDTAEADPAEAPEEEFIAQPEDANDDTAEAFAADPDFSRLQQPEPDADTARPYRIFTRSHAAARTPDAMSDRTETAAAPAPEPDPQPEVQPAVQPEPAFIAAEPPAPQAAAAQAAQPAWDAPPPEAPQAPVCAPAAASIAAPAGAPIDVPAPSMGRGASRAGRVKTRLLGFSPAQAAASDPFARSAEAAAPGYTQFPVGWLAIVQGPGRGAAFTLFSGVTVIGRGADQTVRLDFGDNSISRDNHAAIAYDPEQKSFFIGHGGKANLVRRNGRPVLSTEALSAGDVIRIGETTLRFVPLCGADFGWDQPQHSDAADAAFR